MFRTTQTLMNNDENCIIDTINNDLINLLLNDHIYIPDKWDSHHTIMEILEVYMPTYIPYITLVSIEGYIFLALVKISIALALF